MRGVQASATQCKTVQASTKPVQGSEGQCKGSAKEGKRRKSHLVSQLQPHLGVATALPPNATKEDGVTWTDVSLGLLSAAGLY